VAALRWHDWAHRWSSILETIGLAPRPALSERLGALEALAAEAGTHAACRTQRTVCAAGVPLGQDPATA